MPYLGHRFFVLPIFFRNKLGSEDEKKNHSDHFPIELKGTATLMISMFYIKELYEP